ncbi:hypothetical protein HL42_6832 [Trichophyton rubrum]|nr:hypothetical protein HL42_6832 [Trichophyton rubrum]
MVSIFLPKWLGYYSETPSGQQFYLTYGLTRRCSSESPGCDEFPKYEDCQADNSMFGVSINRVGSSGSDLLANHTISNPIFCSMWRSVGFLISFAVVLEGMTFVAFVVILAGGKQMRETGWKMLTVFLVLIGLVQAGGMGLVSYLFDNDDRFYPGWKLDDSWILCTVSMCLMVVNAVAMYTIARVLPNEGGYELIADHD